VKLLDTLDGIVFNVRKGNFIHDIQHYLLRQEINVRKWFNFRKGGIFVDVGAYIGAYTLRAAKHGSIVSLLSQTLIRLRSYHLTFLIINSIM